MRRASYFTMGAGLAIVAFAAVASADEKDPRGSKGGVITADTVHISMRSPRPQVVTDVSKIAAQRPLSELRQPFLDRVEKVIEKAPF